MLNKCGQAIIQILIPYPISQLVLHMFHRRKYSLNTSSYFHVFVALSHKDIKSIHFFFILQSFTSRNNNTNYATAYLQEEIRKLEFSSVLTYSGVLSVNQVVVLLPGAGLLVPPRMCWQHAQHGATPIRLQCAAAQARSLRSSLRSATAMAAPSFALTRSPLLSRPRLATTPSSHRPRPRIRPL
uniref:Uncharacterized protein n=1 Tax=Arundo donax TaxID=35708 RepID=A0A0A9CM63_ARUDO